MIKEQQEQEEGDEEMEDEPYTGEGLNKSHKEI